MFILGVVGGGQILVIVLVIVLLFFGGKKIPELMRGLGKGVKEFKDASKGEDANPESEDKPEWQRGRFGHGISGGLFDWLFCDSPTSDVRGLARSWTRLKRTVTCAATERLGPIRISVVCGNSAPLV